ncbi:MAG: phage terminase large subunit [Flavisolibacter sp.]
MNNKLTIVYTEAFKRGLFDFITIDNGKKHEKQEEALNTLTDDCTKEFGFGGGAGGAKSWTGCVWLVFMSLLYPDTRWFIGREELKRLRESTFQTFLKVCKKYKIESWKYNGMDHYIQFENGSRIDLLDLKLLPSDPFYERYGSIEYTGGWIEEAGEVNFGAYDTLKSRIGRQNNDKYKILGKLFVTLNPKKNWCHQVFWKPFKSGTLPEGVKFLQALVTDNPHIDTNYIENLKGIKDKVRKQRLLYGNFDYDDDDNALMDYDSIVDLFTNSFVPKGVKYITADVARFGKDNTVIMVWEGWRVEEIHTLKHKKTTEVADYIRSLQQKHGIANSNTVADSDGVGGGVVDELRCKSFVNNSSPLINPKMQTKENYRNLKSQCYYMLAEKVTEKQIYINCTDLDIMEMIISELEQVKKKNADKDSKLEVVGKDEVKELIGRSPDYSDTLMMRNFFELTPKLTWVIT